MVGRYRIRGRGEAHRKSNTTLITALAASLVAASLYGDTRTMPKKGANLGAVSDSAMVKALCDARCQD